MTKFLKVFGLVFVSVIVYIALTSLFYGRLPNFHIFLGAKIVIYALIISCAYHLFYNVLRTEVGLLVCATLLMFSLPIIAILIAQGSNINYLHGGIAIYEDGKLTVYGFFRKLISPYLFFWFYSLYVFLKSKKLVQ